MIEAEIVSQKKTGFVGKALDYWLRPHFFEDPQLYERLGVRFFKDTFITRRRARSIEVKPSIETLRVIADSTKKNEIVHLAGFMGFTNCAVGTAITIFCGEVRIAIGLSAVNLLFNVYPIMVQRYNRIRLNRLISRLEKKVK